MHHGALALFLAVWECKQEHGLVSLAIHVVHLALEELLRQDHAASQLLTPNMELMEHGVLAQSNVVWVHKQEHVHVLLAVYVVLLALE